MAIKVYKLINKWYIPSNTPHDLLRIMRLRGQHVADGGEPWEKMRVGTGEGVGTVGHSSPAKHPQSLFIALPQSPVTVLCWNHHHSNMR